MSDDKSASSQMTDEELEDLVASADTGARSPAGPVGVALLGVCLVWSLFQLWIASPLPFTFAKILPVLNDNQTRSIHLAFAVFLSFTAYPALKRSPRDRIPIRTGSSPWPVPSAPATSSSSIASCPSGPAFP